MDCEKDAWDYYRALSETVSITLCDSFDTLSMNEEIPELYIGDAIYVKNIGAYSSASATMGFNGFPPAKIVLV